MVDETFVKAIEEALSGAKERERKFTESVEISINLKEVDLSDPKKRINEEIPLPHGRGRDVKVGVFGTGEVAVKAKDVADTVFSPEQITELGEDRRAARKAAASYDYFIAEAPLMAAIGKNLGFALGPRGKMPKPIPPGGDPTALITGLRKTVRARSKDNRTFHIPIGTVTMSTKHLAENLEAVLKRIESKLERGRLNIGSSYVKTTMGPSVKLF